MCDAVAARRVRRGQPGYIAAPAPLLGEAPIGGYRARHALLAGAVAAGLLPGERLVLHERIAGVVEAAGEQALAAEAAGHWAAAGRDAEELRARVKVAMAAERVFGYAEAAAHWQRAIELQIGEAVGPRWGHMAFQGFLSPLKP